MNIIDSHVHFWDPGNLSYSWTTGNDTLDRSFLPEDYQAANGEHTVQGIIFVEAGADPQQEIQEVEWIETLDAPIKAIVASALLDVKDGREEILEKLSSRPLVKGIRRLYQDQPVGFARQTTFIKGVQQLKTYDLSFDICIKSYQLDETIELVKQCPDIMFILDHIAKPKIADGEFDYWSTRLKMLAEFDNISCKISGVITEADHTSWTQEQIKPYILETIEAFGINRVMFGSDWPVVNLAGSFTKWVDTLTFAIDQLSTDEKQKLFIDNATRLYRIE
jgi:L-fuconolactonase